MKFKLLLLLLILNIQYSIFNTCVAQDSSRLQISLLTCTPGEELYSTFGHTAIRVIDSNSLTDIVYNYGTFNFDDDNFLLKFVRGKLPYYISTENFSDFKELYQFTNRGITEQILNLKANEKISIRSFLNNNLKEENKYYKYDFTFDNCTTRIKDILKKQQDSSFAKTATMPIGTTFRNAIHVYLNNNQQYWSKLGIDILLGSPMDAKMTIEQQQFLPDNLMHSLDSNKNLITSKQNLYPISNDKLAKPLFTPFIIFTLLLLSIIALSFSKNKIVQTSLNGFYGLYFFILGLLGIILLFMWFATDHGMCKVNYNLGWAIPTHLFFSFVINSKKNWVKKYLKLSMLLQTLVLLSWFFLPQQMNMALLPLVLLSIFISYKKGFATDFTDKHR
ncbi:MAG: DUF4105 domain-containing protein [Ferruginibacter sp.]|nr:DUF4105 domain-containing protein [Ferruginibacter sp.]